MSKYRVYGNIPVNVIINASSEDEAFDKANDMEEKILKHIIDVLSSAEKIDNKEISVGDLDFDDYDHIK